MIADKLDEGYEADDVGVAILSGLVYAFDALSSSLPGTGTNTGQAGFAHSHETLTSSALPPDVRRGLCPAVSSLC